MALEVTVRAQAKNCNKIISTSAKLLQLLLGKTGEKLPSLDKYAGSIFQYGDCEILFLDPLEQLVTVSYGKFLCSRFLSKFLDSPSWLSFPNFTWSLFEPAQNDSLRSLFSTATYISCDIETDKEERGTITCIGFTAIHLGVGSHGFTATTVVVPFTDLYNIAFARTILGLPIPKVFQNGKYDNAYLLRYNCLTSHWLLDTQHMFHSWYSELPKDLGLVTAFCLRNWIYHKDQASEARTDMEYYEYNAKDAFTTAIDMLVMLHEIPPFAWNNYLQEFPQVFPCLLAEMTGIKIDLIAQERLDAQFKLLFQTRLGKIRTMVGNQFYNPGSPPQTASLFELLGSGDIKSTGKIPMDKVMSRHPLNKRILTQIGTYRKEKKKSDTYTGKEVVAFDGRVRYTINPHGTDTGRNSSKESQFWYGLQIQNIPVDPPETSGEPDVKDMFISDPDFYLGEADGEQAEARCVGYLSGDTNLISTVNSDRDYHGINAERFFGVPYDKIIGSDGSVIDKKLRDLSKRTNHGSNYNMGPGVMVDTMGVEKVLAAKRILNLPVGYTLKQVTGHLLEAYATAYPVVKSDFYNKLKADSSGKHMLVGPTGWTRYCFADPNKSKRAMNMYAAHAPQSLYAMILNKAWLSVFYQIALVEQRDFRLLAQIHDSILFMYRKNREDLAWRVKKLMEIPVAVTDTFGKIRTMLVPCDLKGGAERWSKLQKLVH